MRILPSFSISILVLFFAIISCDSKKPPATQVEVAKKEIAPFYEQQGRGVARAASIALSSELQAALKRGGIAEAVEYCNLAAIPLTDSLSSMHKVEIHRTSANLRNPGNVADKGEQEVLNIYRNKFAAEEDIESMVVASGKDHYKYYAPIMVGTFCLQCHGKVGQDISESDYSIIKQLYPDDQAINYELGDFRGIWSIKMEKAGE